VELFSDEEDAGQVHKGSAIADGSGNWAWTGSLTGPWTLTSAGYRKTELAAEAHC
jgi:hypothetical protein